MSIEWDVGCITRKRAQVSPDKTAIIFEDRPIPYRDLNEGVNRCAHLFQKKSLHKGDRLAVVLLNCVEFIEAYFASAKLGAIFVPLNWRLAAPELEYQLKDCGAENVYPAEVEKILSGNPNISNVAIIGVQDDTWGEAGMALIVPRPGQTITEEEVHEYLKDKVARFKHPKHIRFVADLPLTATMKVKKVELKAKFKKP